MLDPQDFIRLRRDPSTGIEAIQARFSGHAYDLHRHDEWLVGVTDSGLQDFFCRGARQRSTSGRVILIEPGELHDGEAGAAGGFAYSMLYLPTAWMRDGLGDGASDDPAVRATLSDDPHLAQAIRHACRRLGRSSEKLALDAALDAVLARLRGHFERPVREPARGRDMRLARRARDCLHQHLAGSIGADALASAAGAADRFHLARAFRAAYATSPHAYLVQQRLVEARRRLRNGEPPAAVAAACGFADQSHLGRWFRRAYGVTPAAYRAGCTGVPDSRVEGGP